MSSAIRIEIFDCSPERHLKTAPIMELQFLSNRITVAQLIRERVAKELERSQACKLNAPPLVELSHKERILNDKPEPKEDAQDVEKYYNLAVAGFRENKYFVIVNDVQVTSLDQEINVEDNTQVEFFRLRPLVGG